MWTLDNSIYRKLHVNLLPLAFVNRTNKWPKNIARHFYIRANWLSYIVNNVIR